MELTSSIATKKLKKTCLFKFVVSILLLNYILFISTVSAEIPERIISLAPNITEILFAIGLGNKIVGITNFCDYPEEAKRKPKVGGMSNPSLEAVVSLKPDIVITTTDGNPKEFEQRLRSLKIKTYIFRARRLTELPQEIRDMGAALGVSKKANAVTAEIETRIKKFYFETNFSRSEDTSASNNQKKVLFIIWPEPLIVAGPGTVIDDAIAILGLDNIASRSKVSYPKYCIEEIIHQAPDIIFIGEGHENMKEISKKLLKKIAMVPAVKKGNVFYLSDALYRLSPRIIKGIEEMSKCLK